MKNTDLLKGRTGGAVAPPPPSVPSPPAREEASPIPDSRRKRMIDTVRSPSPRPLEAFPSPNLPVPAPPPQPMPQSSVPDHRRASMLEKVEQALTDLFHHARLKEPIELPEEFWHDVHEWVEVVPQDPDGFLAHVFEIGPDDPEWPLEHHALNVAILSILTGHFMKLDAHDLWDLAGGALLHDVGLAPMKRLTEQSRRLTDRERRVINLHPYEGERAFADANKGFETVQLIIRQSQERENGSGSPEKLTSQAIHPLSKIVTACDALESLTHRRPYRPFSTARAAFQKLLNEKDLYAHPVLKAMLNCITPFPPGAIVHLSTGVRARVKRINSESCLRPVVVPLGPGKHEGVELDLMHLPHVWIQETAA